jgi:predicted DNA-binding transcriptional regulator AlpA
MSASLALPRALATPADVSTFLGVPLKTLYEWRYKSEGPPAIRVGRHLRYRWDDVESWLRLREAGEA